ncbi:MAG TPA: SusC/RagA family TonB-linked outer membrane protein [Chryseosolibacter sp.]
MKSVLIVWLTAASLLLSGESRAQDRTVEGVVTSQEDNAPLPGVNVVIKGTTDGTTTDAEGRYSLVVPSPESVLVFSFIGLKSQEVVVGNLSAIDVQMAQDMTQLSEVVVVGYATTTQQAFTGTAKVVSSDNIERKSVSNVSKALAGEVPGLQVINNSGQPGTEATIRIRGFGSVNGNRNPLFVVDGVPFSGSLNSINPADIESTTVLKDAAATAIYGSRGANGVIIINTRTGKGQDSFVEVDGQFGTNMSLLPRYDVVTSPEEYIGLSWEAMYNQGVTLGSADPVGYANTRLFSTSGISPNNNIWNVSSGSDLIDPATRTVKPGVARLYNPERWEDYGFQPSSRNEVNIKFGGSDTKTNYYTSIGYLNDVGYSVNSDFQRLSARFNLNHEVKKWLNTSVNFGYAKTKRNRGGQSEDSGSIFWFVDNIPPIYPLFRRDTEGNRIEDPIFGGYQYDYGDTGRKFGSLTNAIADATYDVQRDDRNELNGASSINFNILEGLAFENRLGLQYFNNKYVNRGNKYYGGSASQNGSIYNRRTEMVNYNLLNLLRYNKTFGNHNLDLIAAHEATELSQDLMDVSAFNLVDPDLEDFNNAVVSNPINSYTESYSLESYFAQASYDFNRTYFVSASIRRDGSSRFVKDKWGNFGSIGAGWLISNESFMDNQNIFSSLKLKASYGLIGDQEGVGYYPGYDLYNVDNLNDGPAFSFDTKGNPDLTWETSRMFQTGLEFSVGKYLDGAVDYYIKNTTDLIFDRRVGPSLGYALLKVNDGALRNQGLEFDLAGHILRGRDLYLDLTVNGEMFNNTITRMPIDPSTGKEKILDPQGRFGWGVDHSIFDYYIREFAGVDPEDGRSTWTVYYQDLDGDGQLDAGSGPTAEQVTSLEQFLADNPDKEGSLIKTTTKTYQYATQFYVGKSAIPKVRGAFNLSGGFKGLELSIQMLYSLGGYAYDEAYSVLMGNGLIGGNNWHTDIRKRWQQAGDITDVPRLSNNRDANVSSTSTRFLTKADYLILNNVRLGYDIPARLVSKIGMKNASVWVSGDNLWLKSRRAGFNPSTHEAGTTSMYRYSPLSTLSAGVKVKF